MRESPAALLAAAIVAAVTVAVGVITSALPAGAPGPGPMAPPVIVPTTLPTPEPPASPTPAPTPLPPLPHDITAQAVQTPYRNGVPFLDGEGRQRIVLVPGSVPLAGDWTGNGVTAPGVFEPAPTFRFLGAADRRGHAAVIQTFAVAGDLPVTGEWDGDGRTRFGVYRPGSRQFVLARAAGMQEITVSWAQPDDLPIAGRWEAGAAVSVGLFRPATGEFLLLPALGEPGAPPVVLRLPAQPGDLPVAGDWEGSGVTLPALYRPGAGELLVASQNGPPRVQQAAPPRSAGTPLAGRWDGPGPDRLALARPGPPPNFWLTPGDATRPLQPLDTVALAESFFPVGIYQVDSAQHFPTLRAAGFTAVLPWQNVDPREAARAAQETGLKLALYRTEAERQPDVRPWAIYLADEPYGASIVQRIPPAQTLATVRGYAARLAGRAPLLFLTETANGLVDARANPADWAEFVRVGDAASVDNYPKSKDTVPPNLGGVGLTMRALTDAVGQARPAWFVAQAHAFRNELVLPSPAEARSMTYAALVHGATGIFYFAWDSYATRAGQVIGIRPDPQPSYPRGDLAATPEQLDRSRRLWESLDAARGGLNAELAGLREVLHAPTSSLPYRVRAALPPATPSLRTLLKQREERLWLLAVNLAAEAVQAQVIVEAPLASSRALLGPDAPIAADGRTLPLALEVGGVAVLEVTLR